MTEVRNRWNGGLYEVVERTERSVTLRRLKGGQIFTIALSEFNFSYSERNT